VPTESLELTTPQEAAQFVDETKVDILAPAVGNMRGLLPSMVHGGSRTEDADFLAAIRAGLAIVHINTELRVAWAARTREQPEDACQRGYTVKDPP